MRGKMPKNNRKFYKRLFILAIPIVLQNLITSSLNMLDTMMIGSLGEVQLAAVGVANQFYFLYSLLVMGIGAGCSILIAGFYFSFRTGFVQFRMMKEMIRLLGDGVGKSNKNEDKISSFQAFCISTASRVGTGNIDKQIKKLKEKPHIITGSCGRILELIKKKKITAHTLKTIILDEADSLLDNTNTKTIQDIIK